MLKRKETDFVQVFNDYTWMSFQAYLEKHYAKQSKRLKNDADRRKFLHSKGVKFQKDNAGVEGVAVSKDEPGTKSIRVGTNISVTKEKALGGDDISPDELKDELQKARKWGTCETQL